MKPREEDWAPDMGFEGPCGPEHNIPAPEPETFEDEPQSFTTMRRIEYIGRIHHMAFRSVLQNGFLPPAQVGAMKEIIQNPGMSQRELADALHIQRATATVMLQKMEKAGYIDRRPDQDDQRVSRIYPTQLAIDQDSENKKAINAYFDRCFRGLDPQEFFQLESILTKLGSNIREILAEGPEFPSKE